MKKKRYMSLLFAGVCLFSSVLSSCAGSWKAAGEAGIARQQSGVTDASYTGGKLDMVTKNNFYVTFDDLERGTKYASEESESTFKYNCLSLVAKKTTFYVDASEDGNALRYYRSKNSAGVDPYIDLDVDGRISSNRYVCQVDLKMAGDYNMSGGILQVIYRASGKSGIFWNPMSLDNKGNIVLGGKTIGSISKNRYTNVAVAVDVAARKYEVYINGKYAAATELKAGDMTGYAFSDVRIVQTGGNQSGGLYVDNIALYEGKYPVSIIPDENTAITVNESFEALGTGEYSGTILGATSQAALTVKQSADGNKFLSAKLSYTEAVIAVPRGGIGNDDFIFSVDVYKNNNSASMTMKVGYFDFVTVGKDGAIIVGGSEVFRIAGEEWVNISVAVRADSFCVFVDGILCGEGDSDPDLDTASLVLRGNAGDELKLDNIKMYRAFFPINYAGTMPESSFTVYSAENFDIMGGNCRASVDVIGEHELAKITDIGQNKVMDIRLEDTGLDGNLGQYDTLRMTFYCPEAYNYALLCVLDCGQQSGGWSYYSDYICLDEKGWFTITLDLKEFASARTPDFSLINAISFYNRGWNFDDKGGEYNSEKWGNASESELEIYIHSIELVKN